MMSVCTRYKAEFVQPTRRQWENHLIPESHCIFKETVNEHSRVRRWIQSAAPCAGILLSHRVYPS